jgi:hypothetical protein
MIDPSDVLTTLRLEHRMPAAALLARLRISRPTMMRAIRALGADVVTRGRARRTAYAARRPIRGERAPIPLFRVNQAGSGAEIARLDPVYPQGCALQWLADFDWPLPDRMADGWFEGIPYPLEDLRPQGFLGRQFARLNAAVLQVPENPLDWSEDDVIYAMSVLGDDLPGNYILGEPAYRRFIARIQAGEHYLADAQIGTVYPARALEALAGGVFGSSAGGEFPKFTERRIIEGTPVHVIVKFSGADGSPGTQRFSDLLLCEQLASEVVAQHLGVAAAVSRILQAGGRTFLEVRRFDRHGEFGRSPVCSWLALNSALLGLGTKPWVTGAAALRERGWIDAATQRAIDLVWHFGRLIANTDMHDGNLAFQPGLTLAPVYDMLPMLYAPARGVELPERDFTPPLPLPAEREVWRMAAQAAIEFWGRAAGDQRISAAFRQICADNGHKVSAACASPALG